MRSLRAPDLGRDNSCLPDSAGADMSHAVESLVRRNSSLKRSAKAVLLAIAHYANDEGKSAYPAIRTIARDTGLTNRGVQKAIKQAVKAGELKRFHNFGPHGVNHYEVRIDQLQSKRLQATRSQTRPLPPNSVHPPNTVRTRDLVFKGSNSLKSKKEGAQGGDASESPLEKAKANGYRSCPDCGSWGGRCNCDDYLQASFDRAMRDTLDAGKPGPARLASEEALRRAYADW